MLYVRIYGGGVDKMTYPIYLTHYMFLKSPFEITFVHNSFMQLFLFVVFSLITALILNKLTKVVSERVL